VNTNAQLLVDASDAMARSADLYLDAAGGLYGKINIGAAATTTTVSRAFVGGQGGWETPVNYSQLTPGDHTSGTDPNYIAGSGTLAVVPYVLPGQPLVGNLAVSNVTTGSATVTGLLTTNGGSAATVTLYWGETDAGTNLLLWAHTNAFAAGQWDSGTCPVTNLTGLAEGRNYYATFAATAAGATSVGTPSLKFITGQLAWSVVDDTCGVSGADTATVLIARPGTCTNETLWVNYAAGGDAVAGADYAPAPISGLLPISAGQTNGTLTLTPLFPPFNYGAPKRIVIALTPGAYAIPAASNANCWLATLQSGAYTWNTASNNANWINAACWTPSGFVNGSADVCNVNQGGTAQVTAVSTFYGRLNLNAGSVLNAYASATVMDLHLNGGAVRLPDGSTPNLSGSIAVDTNSSITTGQQNNNIILAVFSGGGTLVVTNRQRGTNTGTFFNGVHSNFNGIWDFYNFGNLSISGDPGNGGMRFGPLGTNVGINTGTHCPWWLDLRGGVVFVCAGTQNPYVHSGPFILQNDAILDATTDGYGKKGLITGRISGPGGLRSRIRTVGASNGSESLILSNSLNDYAGGTVVLSNILEAATAGALGIGNVQVQPGAKLKIRTAGAIQPSASLYLDLGGGLRGVMDLGSATTRVSCAFIGGAGGWPAPYGYVQLAPGVYLESTPATTNYLVGAGALLVRNTPGAVVVIH
jgi:hypothetical protein